MLIKVKCQFVVCRHQVAKKNIWKVEIETEGSVQL